MGNPHVYFLNDNNRMEGRQRLNGCWSSNYRWLKIQSGPIMTSNRVAVLELCQEWGGWLIPIKIFYI
jgi:hypothetical protein